MIFGVGYVHKRSYLLLLCDRYGLVRRNKAVEVTQLDEFAHLFIVGKSDGTLCTFLIRHMGRLQFHTESAGHGYVTTELDGCRASGHEVR